MFDIVADLLQRLVIDEEDVIDAVRQNLDGARDVELPPRAQHDEENPETTEEWGDVERARREYLEEITPQATAEAAAEFGVRMELAGVEPLKKW
jgi:DNA-binding IscR family transcriptional regulator